MGLLGLDQALGVLAASDVFEHWILKMAEAHCNSPGAPALLSAAGIAEKVFEDYDDGEGDPNSKS